MNCINARTSFGKVNARIAKPHFTRKAVGEWLEAKFPQQYVDKIISRNPYIADYSVQVKLTSTDGKEYVHDLLNPVGLQLVVMESDLPKALGYKTAVAKLIWDGQFLSRICRELTLELAPIKARKAQKARKARKAGKGVCMNSADDCPAFAVRQDPVEELAPECHCGCKDFTEDGLCMECPDDCPECA